MTSPSGPGSAERGSVLLLVPAGILVLLILASLAVDSALVLFAERDLQDRTAALSNDLANTAADDAKLYDDGVVELRQDVADAYVGLAIDPAHPPRGYERWSASAVVSGREVTVVAEASVRPIFARAVPGLGDAVTVRAQSTAVAAGG